MCSVRVFAFNVICVCVTYQYRHKACVDTVIVYHIYTCMRASSEA